MEINSKHIWIVPFLVLLLSLAASKFFINEEDYIAWEEKQNRRILRKDIDLIKHLEKDENFGFLISEWMPTGWVFEFRNKFLCTFDRYKNFKPVNFEMDINYCDFKNKRKMKKLSELLICEPNSYIFLRKRNLDELLKNYPKLNYETIDSSRVNYLLRTI